ncbi:hypothetical protein TNCV_1326381 [Trichonephila clavipes]|nr:hypothetical protein TNCV_1326381 [Trichonephila clavipes]
MKVLYFKNTNKQESFNVTFPRKSLSRGLPKVRDIGDEALNSKVWSMDRRNLNPTLEDVTPRQSDASNSFEHGHVSRSSSEQACQTSKYLRYTSAGKMHQLISLSLCTAEKITERETEIKELNNSFGVHTENLREMCSIWEG